MKRLSLISLFIFSSLFAETIFYGSLCDISYGLNYDGISVFKCGLVFKKIGNIGFGTTFMEGFRITKDTSQFEGAPMGFFPLTIYFLPYTGVKKGIFKFPIVYSYFEYGPFLLVDVKSYYKLGVGLNFFIFSIEGGYCYIKYYPVWSIEKSEKFYLNGIISLGFWGET